MSRTIRTKNLFAAALAACALSATASLAGSPVAPVADAAAATSVQGTATTSGGTRAAGAAIWLYRYTSSGWQSLGQRTTANANGAYFIGGLADGWYYQVRAYKVFGVCAPGVSRPVYDGWSQMLLAGGGARGANIRMDHVGYFPQYPNC